MNQNKKILLAFVVGFVLVAAGAVAFWQLQPGVTGEFIDAVIPGAGSAQTTKGVDLPEDAKPVDEHFYKNSSAVYMLSVTGTTTLPIPGADAKSFKRLVEYTTLSTPQILADCGGAGQYTFYADLKTVYFYQVWKTPGFTASKIRVVKGADPNDFVITSPTTAKDKDVTYTIGYEKATTTCSYVLTS